MFIPDQYILDKEMSSNEKVILALIYSFNNTENLSVRIIADELGLTSPTVLKSLKVLNRLCLIDYADKIYKIESVEEEFKKER